MTHTESAFEKAQTSRALDVSIHIGLAFLLVAACLLILKPFIPMITWGIIIAVAIYPWFLKFRRLLGERGGLAATLITTLLLAILILPVLLLAQSLIGAIQAVAANVKSGAPIVPPPPANIADWPLIGSPLATLWGRASNDLSSLFSQYAEQIKSVLPGILSTTAGLGATVVQLLLSIVIAGVLLANAQSAFKATCALFNRLFGDRGDEYRLLVGNTIRSVTFGILGVALIQSAFATIGFFFAGLPGVGLWAAVFLIAAVLQMGALVLIPAVIYVFATGSRTAAIVFTVWCLVVGLMDNVLKPLLLGRGAAVPIAVIFLGAIGGFIVLGIIGLFIGAIVLSVGYKLLLAWLEISNSPQAHV